MKEETIHTLTGSQLDEVKARAVMGFVNMQVEAMDSESLSGTLDLRTNYRHAQVWCEGAYHFSAPDFTDVWGAEIAKACGMGES